MLILGSIACPCKHSQTHTHTEDFPLLFGFPSPRLLPIIFFTPFNGETGKKIQNEIPLLIIFIPKWPIPSKHTPRHTNTIKEAHTLTRNWNQNRTYTHTHARSSPRRRDSPSPYNWIKSQTQKQNNNENCKFSQAETFHCAWWESVRLENPEWSKDSSRYYLSCRNIFGNFLVRSEIDERNLWLYTKGFTKRIDWKES